MKKNNQIIISELMALCAILIVAIIMTAYSLKSNNKKFNVYIEHINNPVLNGVVYETKKPELSKNSISNYELKFTNNSNSIAYSFNVVNKGNVDAKISELEFDTPICKQNNITTNCNELFYNLIYSGSGFKVSHNDVLKAGETKTMVLFIKVNADNVTVSNLNLRLKYE